MNPIISIAQTHIQFGDTANNVSNAKAMIQNAAQNGSSLIIFPELWTSGYDYAHINEIALQNEIIISDLTNLSKNLNISIGGSYILKHQNGISNTFMLIDPTKGSPANYNKIHLFKQLKEDQYFNAGNSPLIHNTTIGMIGFSVCYDLRFPELYRYYTRHGVQINIICAEWPESRQLHWNTLLAARAIENQCFMVAVNCVGSTGNIVFAGQSQAVNPWGEILTKASATTTELIHQEIDLEELLQVRSQYPFQKDAKPSLFN